MLLMTITSIASARTYYVSPNGNDSNSGTFSQPWGTLNKAFSSAIAGDTVYFRGGTYLPTSESQLGYTDRDGTMSDPICFFNFPGETPIIDCSNVLSDNFTYAIRGNYANFIEIRGLVIRNLNQSNSSSVVQGIEFYMSSNIKIEQCTVYNVEGVGFGFHGVDELYVKNCDAYNLCDSLQSPYPGQNGTGFACGTRLSYGESMYQAHCYFEGCRTWNFSDNGFACAGVGYMEFKNCWAFSGGALFGEGIGFKFSMSTNSSTVNPLSHYVTNCISALNGNCGFTPNNLNGTVFNGNYYNNFLFQNGFKHELYNYDPTFGYGLKILNYIGSTPAPNEMYTNNLSYKNERGDVYVGDIYRHDINSWDIQVEVKDEDFISLDWEEMLLPRKSDGSLPDINFGKLSQGSDLINAGKNVGLPYNGSAPDLGWHESSYEVTNTTPIPAIPVYLSSAIQNATPSRLDITYDLALANIIPATSAFNVRVNNESRSVSSVTVSGTKVFLTLSSPVAAGNSITVAYTKPATNPVQTTAGGQADSFSARNVTNNVAAVAVAPVFVSALIANATPSRLEITYDLALAIIIPASSAFSVRVNSESRNVASVAVSGTKVFLTLSSPVAAGNSVTVAYLKPAFNPIQTVAGGHADSFTARSVTNNVSPLNQSPTISIASPTKSNYFTAPATITIETTVSDPNGNLSRVEFYQGTSKIGELTSSPYSFVWKEVPAGTYSLTAVAVDNLNFRTVSSPVTVIVEKSVTTTNQLPLVSISVSNKKKPKKHDNLIITADASDPDGTISKVVLKNGDTVIEEKTSAPYVFTLPDVDTGRYDFQAIAFDNLGASNIASLQLYIEDNLIYNNDLLRIYPNPNNGTFNIDLSVDESTEGRKLSIVSLNGKQVFTNQISGDIFTVPVSLNDITPGTYIVILAKGKEIQATRKFIKY